MSFYDLPPEVIDLYKKEPADRPHANRQERCHQRPHAMRTAVTTAMTTRARGRASFLFVAAMLSMKRDTAK